MYTCVHVYGSFLPTCGLKGQVQVATTLWMPPSNIFKNSIKPTIFISNCKCTDSYMSKFIFL